VAAVIGVLLFLVAAAAAAPPARVALGLDGQRAFDMARAAEDGVAADSGRGEALLKEIQGLKAAERDAEGQKGIKALQDEANAAHAALEGYRKQALASAAEAFQLLADGLRAATGTPDPVRLTVLEQRALLAAHEAAVMAARARAEAERLRAVLAEGKALLASGRAPALTPAAGAAPGPEPAGREVVVPNVVGARLEQAARDLQVVGLRLGRTAGPRDGFVVKQVPPAGARVLRQAAVSLTLSATAAGAK